MPQSSNSQDREKLIQQASDLLAVGYHCSEAIMLAIGRHYLPDLGEQGVRMSTPFGGGIGGTRSELCGAFAAGVMVIGGLHGRLSRQTDDSAAYALAAALRTRFLERWQSTTCGPVRDAAARPDGTSGCGEVVAETARILLDILEETPA
jgi:C_GCAxxG_C_C family probable redox protein